MVERKMPSRRRAQVAEAAPFSLDVRPRGLFTLLVPAGACADENVEAIERDFLKRPALLAVDLSGLDPIPDKLLAALHAYAASLDPAQGRLVFVRPPFDLRSRFRTAGGEDFSPLVLGEADLEGSLEQVEERLRAALQRLLFVRRQLGSNVLWRLAGPGQEWFCPFCATLQPEILFAEEEGDPSDDLVERVLRHLSDGCPRYVDGAAGAWPREVLEGTAPASPVFPRLDAKMVEKLQEAEKARCELALARERHRRLLPAAPPKVGKCEIAALYRPADAVGGDFYEFVTLPFNRFGLIIGDVSGHGIEAAILMGMAKKVLEIRLRDSQDPLHTLIRANEDLYKELDRQSFVTALVAVIDVGHRGLWLARAGHVPPLLARKGTLQRLEPPGTALGLLMPGAFERGIQHQRQPLESGDAILFATDGLEDVKDRSGDAFGPERIDEVFRAHAAQPASEALDALSRALELFGGAEGFEDDVTALCLRIP